MKISIGMLGVPLVLACIGLVGCQQQPSYQSYQPAGAPAYQQAPPVSQVQQTDVASAGLDLQALMGLVQQAPNAQALEARLNEPGGINNVDLNHDGNVDYLRVIETSGHCLSVLDTVQNDQQIAQLCSTQTGPAMASFQVVGNPVYYGPGQVYTTPSVSFGEALFLSWLFAPHAYYVSPYHYGYYPSIYHPYGYVAPSVYHTRTTTVIRQTRVVTRQVPQAVPQRGLGSPNAGAQNAARQLPPRDPIGQGSSFHARDQKKEVGFGGFRPSSGPAPAPRTFTPPPTRSAAPAPTFGRRR